MFRYWPGPVVLVAMVIGWNFTVMSVFLTRFATHLGLQGISTYFIGYAVAAFAFRLGTRTWSETMGRHRMVLLGLAGVSCGQSLLLLVSADWHLIFPALAAGFGHALLFPAVVSLGAGAFPTHYRGTGTTLVLGFTEVGQILSAPILGTVIDYFGQAGFAQMFVLSTLVSVSVAFYYALTAARRPDQDLISEPVPSRALDVAPSLPLTAAAPRPAPVLAEQPGESRAPIGKSA